MTPHEKVIKEGVWLYDNAVECKIRIVTRNISFGTGDIEDPKEISEDKEGKYYYILYHSPTEPNRVTSETGSFETLEEATTHAVESTRSTVKWL